MWKKLCFLLIVFLIFNANIIGQESKHNVFYGGLSFAGPIIPSYGFGFDIGYERMINNNFSLSVGIGTEMIILQYIDIYALWYLMDGNFFLGLGMGGLFAFFGKNSFLWPFPEYAFTIHPTFGWKINIGRNDRFVFFPSITHRICIFPGDEAEFRVLPVPLAKAKILFGFKF